MVLASFEHLGRGPEAPRLKQPVGFCRSIVQRVVQQDRGARKLCVVLSFVEGIL